MRVERQRQAGNDNSLQRHVVAVLVANPLPLPPALGARAQVSNVALSRKWNRTYNTLGGDVPLDVAPELHGTTDVCGVGREEDENQLRIA